MRDYKRYATEIVFVLTKIGFTFDKELNSLVRDYPELDIVMRVAPSILDEGIDVTLISDHFEESNTRLRHFDSIESFKEGTAWILRMFKDASSDINEIDDIVDSKIQQFLDPDNVCQCPRCKLIAGLKERLPQHDGAVIEEAYELLGNLGAAVRRMMERG